MEQQCAPLELYGRRECRDVAFEPILCAELLIISKIEQHRVMHQQRVVDHMRPYGEDAALEWAELGTPEPESPVSC